MDIHWFRIDVKNISPVQVYQFEKKYEKMTWQLISIGMHISISLSSGDMPFHYMNKKLCINWYYMTSY